MQFNFKKFEGRNKRHEDRITITKSGGIGFPTRFYQDNNLANFKYVILYWDEGNKAIGIQFNNDESEKNKFSILKSGAGYGGNIIARSFFKDNRIENNKYYGKYEWVKQTIDGIGEVYTVVLKERQN